jgi:hypothetical protein
VCYVLQAVSLAPAQKQEDNESKGDADAYAGFCSCAQARVSGVIRVIRGGAVEVADNVGLVEDDVTAATDEIEAMSVPAAIEGNPAARDAIADVGRAEAVPAADVSCPKMELTMPPWAVTLAVKRITTTIEKRIFSTEAVSS